ncbi:MAG: hypothetical protein MPI91_08365 [Nitrosopumilus sp.]|nr:hypothetical protein [Nitrosopumilus sp.]MDA7973880.1 hypothetical protein [Nitrosopumilus sp.]
MARSAPAKGGRLSSPRAALLASLGVDPAKGREMELDARWASRSFNHDRQTNDVPIIVIERGPKNMAEVKNSMRNFDACIVLFEERDMLFLKATTFTHTVSLGSPEEYERIASILASCDIAGATSEITMIIAITKAINAIPNATGDFDNRGIFSTHYLRNRLFGDIRWDADSLAERIRPMAGQDPGALLEALGWDQSDTEHYGGRVSITVTGQDDFSIRQREGDIAPSYTAVSSLKSARWAILTNGRKWRLYTSRISASSTNYFEVTLDPGRDATARYLAAIFGAASFEERDGRADIDAFFDEGRNYATGLEEDLSSRIMRPDGLFLDMVKGTLDHDMEKVFSAADLERAKQTALKIMYRVWFLAYAESRDLLPTRDDRYSRISLQSIRGRLDSYEADPEGTKCWESLLKLFSGVRDGDSEHNLPQYSGDLFKETPSIDGIKVRNRFITSALHGLLERDGESMDYSSLSVRHLGNIFETLMEFSVRQAESDILLLEDKGGVREVKSSQDATYSYKRNDLYLASKGGIVTRKMSASYYTPDRIVEFLVRRGLEPILEERTGLIAGDLARYKKSKSKKNLQTCMDRLLDIQVLDPAMGSGHFLVEALNQMTQWATDILERHPDHPLLQEIESDRDTVLAEQRRRGITIDENLLTHDVLLKRKIMKRCIFGVDLNPMAVELAKLSLWLDSFAIGVPLTYMDHHIKNGDSIIGMYLDDLNDPSERSLDDWMPGEESGRMICDVITSSDITVEQVRTSEDRHHEYVRSLKPTRWALDALAASKIVPRIFPKKGRLQFVRRFGKDTDDADLAEAREPVSRLSDKYKFFHWELEMLDAFVDSRRGFDLVVGNPPWDKVKPSDDEFFSPIYPPFRSLKPNTKKKKKIEDLCSERSIQESYDDYKAAFRDKSSFCSTYDLQDTGDKEMWKLVLERAMQLVSADGMVSMLLPSQLLSNVGGGVYGKRFSRGVYPPSMYLRTDGRYFQYTQVTSLRY